MGYRIPDDEQLADAIEQALARQPIVESQRELGDTVRRVLQAEDETLRASDRRIRRVAVEEGLVQVRVRTGTTSEPAREQCPVCGEPVERVKNRTLDGGEAVVGTRCPSCSYTSGARHEVPLRYVFHRADDARATDAAGPF